jgi:hypothetical protein
VSIAHKKTAIFALSTLSTMFGRLRSAHKTPCNHYTSPYTPFVAGDAAAAIDLAINRAKMGMAGHPMHRCNPSSNQARANGGQLPQRTYRINNQLVEEARSKRCGHHNNKK